MNDKMLYRIALIGNLFLIIWNIIYLISNQTSESNVFAFLLLYLILNCACIVEIITSKKEKKL